jgi:hypothetical protein
MRRNAQTQQRGAFPKQRKHCNQTFIDIHRGNKSDEIRMDIWNLSIGRQIDDGSSVAKHRRNSNTS